MSPTAGICTLCGRSSTQLVMAIKTVAQLVRDARQGCAEALRRTRRRGLLLAATHIEG